MPEHATILDIGPTGCIGHVVALDGHKVTALDLSATMIEARVVRTAEAMDIRLLANEDLEHPAVLS